ncbi:P-loop containing nucleoside triphosphate hydrolase protein [Apiospora kogelbergensis]|uniref:P-loop containing nucleoside triphosphate hydrolase protein n=1 Tax=Apiospora kogelbergensis TaxID=1337665 RepID=UPI00312FB926
MPAGLSSGSSGSGRLHPLLRNKSHKLGYCRKLPRNSADWAIEQLLPDHFRPFGAPSVRLSPWCERPLALVATSTTPFRAVTITASCLFVTIWLPVYSFLCICPMLANLSPSEDLSAQLTDDHAISPAGRLRGSTTGPRPLSPCQSTREKQSKHQYWLHIGEELEQAREAMGLSGKGTALGADIFRVEFFRPVQTSLPGRVLAGSKDNPETDTNLVESLVLSHRRTPRSSILALVPQMRFRRRLFTHLSNRPSSVSASYKPHTPRSTGQRPSPWAQPGPRHGPNEHQHTDNSSPKAIEAIDKPVIKSGQQFSLNPLPN